MNTIKLNVIGELTSSAKGGSGGGGGGSVPIEKPIGVFIYTTDGEFITSDAWNSANNDKVVGIFVNDGEHDFVIATQDASDSYFKWGGNDKYITSTITIPDSNEAKLDFFGASNTTNIIEELKEYTDDKGILGAPSCEACANFVFPNGENGYLPAIGEWILAHANKTIIDNAIAKCGGINISGYYWSSSKSSKYGSWSFYWGYGYVSSYSRDNSCKVRAFCKI